MKMKVLFHDSCFDGHASAAIFSRFYREKIRPDAEFEFVGVQHKAGGEGVDPALFTGDENAIVDFRYSQNPKLTWWFDHHQSAFQQPGDEAHFQRDTTGKKFHNPHRKSCTRYIADIARDRFFWDPKPMEELIHWGEIIDGALFDSPQMAVELKEPALQLMTVLEANRDPKFSERIITELQAMPMSQVVAQDYVQKPLRPLLEKHQKDIALVRSRIQNDDGIVHWDLGDDGIDSVNKFIAYYLFPNARYTVWVGKSDKRAKVSLGSNPWHPEWRKHDLSKLAERYGGGGHPVVAAVSFKPEDLEKARKAAAEIRAELAR